MEDEMLLDQKQTAILFGVSDRTIRRWKRAGYLPEPAIKHKHKCRWRYSDLLQIIYERTKADKSGHGD